MFHVSRRFGAALCGRPAFFVLLTLLGSLGLGQTARAATFAVTNTNDSGAGSLRDAITNANNVGGTNTVDATGVTGTISLGSALPNLNTPITITGPGANLLAVTESGAGGSTFIFFVDGATANLSGLTISNGYADIFNFGTLTVTNSILSGGSSGQFGLYNYGAATLTNCAINDNQNNGLYNSGGTVTCTGCTVKGSYYGFSDGGGALALTNCTASGNVFGVASANGSGAATLTATNCTVSGNDTGLVIFDGTIVLKNSLSVGNTYNVTDYNIGGTLTDGGYNIMSGSAADAGLNPAGLADNGGPTKTIALLAGSPAINAGSNALIPGGISFDQRGNGFARIYGGTVDIGAFELQPVGPPASTPNAKVTGGGWISVTGGRANFGLTASVDNKGKLKGELTFDDSPSNVFVKSTEITSVVVNGTHATIYGTAKINGAGSYAFVVDVDDKGEPGKGVDTFRIQVTPYSSGATAAILGGGNIQVHK